jgi:hypothetical protein
MRLVHSHNFHLGRRLLVPKARGDGRHPVTHWHSNATVNMNDCWIAGRELRLARHIACKLMVSHALDHKPLPESWTGQLNRPWQNRQRRIAMRRRNRDGG